MRGRRGLPQIALTYVSVAVIAVGGLGAFVGLSASSLWTDELFSAHFSTGTPESFGAWLWRVSADVNPPGYYLLLWVTRELVDMEFTLLARGLSAALGCAAIAMVIAAPTRSVGRTPRLVAGAVAASSLPWFLMTQEARAYALEFLLVAALLAASLRALERLRGGRVPWGTLAAAVVVGTAASLAHYYALLVAGAVFAGLLVAARNRRARLVVTAAGALVLACTVAVLVWHLPRMAPELDDTWFTTATQFLLEQLAIGVKTGLIGGRLLVPVFGVLAVFAVWATFRRGPGAVRGLLAADHAGASILLLGGVVVLTVVFAWFVSVAFTPMLSHRLFYLLSPAVWIAIAYVTQAIFDALDEGVAARLFAAAVALALVIAATVVRERGRDDKQAWRHSAEAVAALDGCVSAELPVVWWEQAYFRDNNPEHFYGYYLPDGAPRRWLPVPRRDGFAALDDAAVASLVARTAAGARDCRLLLWHVHFAPLRDQDARVTAALARHLPDPGAGEVVVERIAPAHGPPRTHARLYLLRRR